MSGERLPKVRELPPRAAQGVMLGRIGSLLRQQYGDLLKQPVPERLSALIEKLT